jgi:hypothetical protein
VPKVGQRRADSVEHVADQVSSHSRRLTCFVAVGLVLRSTSGQLAQACL